MKRVELHFTDIENTAILKLAKRKKLKRKNYLESKIKELIEDGNAIA